MTTKQQFLALTEAIDNEGASTELLKELEEVVSELAFENPEAAIDADLEALDDHIEQFGYDDVVLDMLLSLGENLIG